MRIYACLLGEWIDITETATVADCQNPVTYFQENLRYEDGARNAKCSTCTERLWLYVRSVTQKSRDVSSKMMLQMESRIHGDV